jgi:hypothetical protein
MAVPEKYLDICKRAIDQIHKLHIQGELKAVYHDEDAKEVEPLLSKWQKGKLSSKEAMKLVDMLFVTGEQLYRCEELPECKPFMDKYQRHWLSDEDDRFQHAYAIMDDCPQTWTDEKGYYKYPIQPVEWATRNTEVLLGLRDDDGRPKKSIKCASVELQARLKGIELNIRHFLAAKLILDAAMDAVGIDVPGDVGILADLSSRLMAYVDLYNIRLQVVKDRRTRRDRKETRLEKVLKTLPAIDMNKLRPNTDSMKRLENSVLANLPSGDWFREQACSLEYDDGFSFKELLDDK